MLMRIDIIIIINIIINLLFLGLNMIQINTLNDGKHVRFMNG